MLPTRHVENGRKCKCEMGYDKKYKIYSQKTLHQSVYSSGRGCNKVKIYGFAILFNRDKNCLSESGIHHRRFRTGRINPSDLSASLKLS